MSTFIAELLKRPDLKEFFIFEIFAMNLIPNHHTPLNQQKSGFDVARGYKINVSEKDCQSTEKWGDIDTFCNEYGFYQDTASDKLIGGPESQSFFLGLHQPAVSESNDLHILEKQYSHYINNVGASSDGDKEKNGLSSSNILKHDLTEFKSCDREHTSAREDGTGVCNPILSTDHIMRLAGERFIDFASHKFININANLHPYGSNLTGLTEDEKLDVELVQLLLTVAEKVSNKKTDKACRLLSDCRKLASNIGRPVQRTVFYFAEALAKKIERETGQIVCNIKEEKNPEDPSISSKVKHHNVILALYQKLPFPRVMQFAVVQTMLEKINMNSKVHLIDIQMRIGVTWAVMMLALAKQEGYNVKKLKLTIIETIDKEAVEAACTHLHNFAKTLNLLFSHHIIFISDMKDLTHNLFEVEDEEVIVAHASFILGTMIARPLCLESLMNTMKRLNPSVLVISEVEANHNSPSFVNRFIEAFFYYGAIFDILEDCMERNDQDRVAMEAGMFRPTIHNIVSTEGTERVNRSVKFEVWRAFFERFGMVEAETSESSLYQAQLVLQTFPCANSFSLRNKGKGIVVGWKGTPLYTLSAWTFSSITDD